MPPFRFSEVLHAFTSEKQGLSMMPDLLVSENGGSADRWATLSRQPAPSVIEGEAKLPKTVRNPAPF